MMRFLLFSQSVVLLLLTSALPVAAQPDLAVSDNPISLPPRKLSAQSLQASPDGKVLAATFLILQRQGKSTRYVPSGTRVQLWEVATGKPLWQTGYVDKTNTPILFSPDGSRLLFPPYLHDVATGMRITSLEAEKEEKLGGLLFTPDGKQIIGNSFTRKGAGKAAQFIGYKAWNAVSGKRRPWFNRLSPYSVIAFSGEGRHLLTYLIDTEGDRRLEFVFSVHSWPELQLQKSVTLGNLVAQKMTFSPDGSRMAMLFHLTSHAKQNKEWEIGIWNVETGELETLVAPDAAKFGVSRLEFSHDGKTLIGSGTVLKDGAPSGVEMWFWDVETGQLERTLNKDKKFGRDIGSLDLRTQIAADGKSFFMSAGSEQVELRSLANGALIRVFTYKH